MAIIKPGIAIAGIRGKLGGIVFSENATACYARSYSRPPKSHSQGQVLARSRLVSVAASWAPLDPADKTLWDAFALAPNELDYDPWGDQRYLTGFQWYVRAQNRRGLVSLAPQSTCPSGAAAPAPTTLSCDVHTPAGDPSLLAWDSASFAADYSAIAFAAITPSLGSTDLFTGWKLVLALQNPGDTGDDISAGLLSAFGNYQADWYCFVRVFSQAPEGNRSLVATCNAQIVA